MRNRIFGAIGVLWGGAVLLSGLLRGSQSGGSGAYQAGQRMGILTGALLFGVGLYYLIKGPSRKA
jgi:hypothetical protein